MRIRHIHSGTEYIARLTWAVGADYPEVVAAGIAEPIDPFGFIVLEATAAEKMVLPPDWREVVPRAGAARPRHQ